MNIDNFNKVSKYVFRLSNSLNKKKISKAKEYFDHLKFHIQLGGADGENVENVNDKIKQLTEFGEQLDKTIKLIDNSPDKYKYTDSSKIQSELQQCETEKLSLTEKITELETKLQEKSTEIGNLKVEQINKPEENNTKIDELNEEIKKLNDEKENLTNQITELTTTNTKSNEDLNKIKSTVKSVLGLTGDVEEGIDDKLKELRDKSDKYSKAISQIIAMSNETTVEGDEADKIESALKNLKKRLESNDELSDKLKVEQENVKNMTKQIEELTASMTALEKLKDSIESKDKEIAELRENNQVQQKQITNLTDEQSKVSSELDKISTELKSKLELLLKSIYGDKDIVNTLMTGALVGGFM
jgi:chromosome segregation ATPase